MERLFGHPLLNFLIAPTLLPGSPEMSLQERLLGQFDSTGNKVIAQGALPYYTSILTILAAFIASYYIIYAGYQMYTAFGDEAKYAQGKKTLLYAVIGFAISIMSYIVIHGYASLLGYTGG